MKQAGRFLSKYIKRNFGVFAIYMLLCILCSILSLIAPYISGNFIDVLLHIEQREQLVKYCVVFATMSFGSIACNYIISQIFARLRIKMNYEINMDFLHHIRKISILTLQKQTTASITQKLNYDTGIVTSFSLQTLQNILTTEPLYNELIRTKIKEIIGELEDSKKNLYTDNCILNSVLNIKYSAAQVADIKIESNIFVPKYMNIDYGDMGVLFGNLLDNAIEANQGVDRKKRWINVSVKYEEHILIINIKNSKIRGSRRKKKGYLNHGIGLNSVKQIVEKFNGIVEVQDFGEMYEVSAILYGICDDKDLGKSVL